MIEGSSSRPVEIIENDKKASSRSATTKVPSVRNESFPIIRNATEDPLAEFYTQARHDQEAEVCSIPDIRRGSRLMVVNFFRSLNSGSSNLSHLI